MKKPAKKIILIGLVALIIVGGGLWWHQNNQLGDVVILEPYLSPGSKQSDYFTITSQNKGKEKIITNVEEGVSVKLPQSWKVSAEVTKRGARLIEAAYSKEVASGVRLIIAKQDNPKNLSLDEWVTTAYVEDYYKSNPDAYQRIKTTVSSRPAYRITKKEIVGTDILINVDESSLGPDAYAKLVKNIDEASIIQKSQVQLFYLQARNSAVMYEINCIAEGEKFLEGAETCRKIVETALNIP